MNLKNGLKKIPAVYPAYKYFKYKKRVTKNFEFVDRKKDSDHLCFILAGYQQPIWKAVFSRLYKFIPSDWDVCIVSSGLVSDDLKRIADEYAWSYLAIHRNNLALAQNVVIQLFRNADYIFKMDEDIFVTDGIFQRLETGYNSLKENSEYLPGVVAPVINVNSFTFSYFLRHYKLTEQFEKKFEEIKRKGSLGPSISTDSEAAWFLWNGDGKMPTIDQIADDAKSWNDLFEPCSIRFNVGLIMFKREIWEKMKMFPVHFGNGLGKDEADLDIFCLLQDRPIVIVPTAIAGHLGYGPQKTGMMKYFYDSNERFAFSE